MKSLYVSLIIALLGALNISTALAAPTISATQDDGTPAATRKLVGDTVTYTTTISNTAAVIVGSTANDASGVQLTNATPANTTDVGSVTISPIAFDDVYPQTILPNIGINSANIPYSAITNDFLGTPAVTTIASFTQPAHGTVTMTTSGANIGQFTYEPAAGYTGADSFTYTLTNSVGSSVGTVNLTVAASPIVWFVNPAVGATGTGTLSSPFKTVAEAVTAIGTNTGHRIFLYSGSQTTGITLKANGWLVGQAATGTNFDSVMGISPASGQIARPALNTTKPALSNASGSVVTLADNNTVLGVAISGGATGAAVASSGTVNTGLIGNAATSDVTISGAAGGAFSLGAGNGNFNVNATITSVTGRSVAVAGRAGGAVSFTGAISDTGTGISLTTNTGGTINFTGGLSLSTGVNTAFSATGGGTVNATQNNSTIVNTLTTTTGTALNVVSTTIGASGLTFRSISANGATKGISLSNTTGSFTVTGTGTTDASGGTIQNTSGRGIEVIGPSSGSQPSITIKNMHLTNTAQTNGDSTTTNCGITGASGANVNCSAAVHLNNVNGVTVDNVNINGSNQNGINGLNVIDLQILNSTVQNCGNESGENGVFIQNLSGLNNLLSNSTFQSNNVEQFSFVNWVAGTLGTLASPFNVSGCTFIGKGNTVTPGGDGFFGNVRSSGTAYISVGGGANTASHFRSNYSYGTEVLMNDNASGTFIVNGCDFGTLGTTSTYNNSGVAGGISQGSTLNTTFTNNTIYGSAFGTIDNGTAILMTTGTMSSGATLNATVTGNTIGSAGTSASGCNGNCNGIYMLMNGSGAVGSTATFVGTINNNSIHQVGAFGIEYLGGDQNKVTGVLHVNGNTIDTPFFPTACSGTSACGQGIFVSSETSVGSLSPNNSTMCADIGGGGANTVNGSWNSFDIRVQALRTSTFKVAGWNGSPAGDPTAFIASKNTGSDGVIVGKSTGTTNPGTFTGDGSFCSPLFFSPRGVSAAQPIASRQTGLSGSKVPVIRASTPVTNLGTVTVVPSSKSQARNLSSVAPAVSTTYSLSQPQLDAIVAAALERWSSTGLTPQQLATLHAIKFEVADLPGLQLGEANGNGIRVSRNAGGNSWFIDRNGDTPVAGVDLLTVVMHEMGHALGLDDTYAEQDRDNLMYGYLTKRERRLPAKDQARGIIPNEKPVTHFLTGAVNIGTLPPNKSVKVVYAVTVGPITGNPQSISSQATVSGSNFTSVLATDAVAGSGPTITLLGIVPVFTSANGTTFTVGTLGTFNVTANGAPGPTFSFTGSLPSGVGLSSAGVLTGTPAAGTGGTYPITITASNGIGTAPMQSFTLTVNQAPAITTANNTTFTVGTNGNFQLTASGFPTSYTFTNTGNVLPNGVTLSASGLLSGTPAAGTGGVYNLTFQVSNGIAPNGTQSFTLTVNQAPAITSANTTTFTKGTAGNFNVIATGYPSPAINLTGGTLPIGVNFGTGTLAGTATVFGTYPLTFTASNGVGSNAVQSFSLVVNPSAQDVKSKPSISVNPGGGFLVSFVGNPGTQYTIQFAPTLPASPAVPNWQTLSLQTADASGMFSAIDNPLPPGTTQRFYRAIIP